jgi:N-dimethylarginine dimethylaminohydrolase
MEPFGYTVHSMPLQGNLLHSLSVMCLLREGLMLAFPPAFKEGLPAPLKDWEVIEITESEAAGFATVGVSLDPSRYLIDPRHTRIMEELDKRGIEPVPMPCDQIFFWGGAIRCITLPLARD